MELYFFSKSFDFQNRIFQIVYTAHLSSNNLIKINLK